jgi:hypothetical protein
MLAVAGNFDVIAFEPLLDALANGVWVHSGREAR